MSAHRRTGGLLLAAWLLTTAPASPLAPAAPGAAPAFVDRAARWGLAFRYSNGATGKLYYPEIVAGGAALFDYDGDGDLDVFVVQGKVLEPGQAAAHPIVPAGGRLFRNDLIQDGVRHATPRFVDVTAASGIRADGYGMGVAVGDFDGDGRPDLYLLNFGPNQLWRNHGDGTFTEVARAAGADDPRMSLSASFADLDGDGWLDLYVADYVEFDVARNVRCSAASSRADYCGPAAFPPAPHRLLRNRGDGTFEDVSLRSGIARASGRGMGVVAADFDGDGRPDLFVANDGTANFLFHNRGGFAFDEVALPAGVAVDGDGRVKANMGIAVGDVDDDGDWDLFVTHIPGEGHTLWVNAGDGTFEDRTAASGLAAASLASTGFGTGFLDYDNDGRLDLLAVDGAVRTLEEPARRGDPFPFAERPQMFRNLGGGRFAEVTGEMGEAFRRAGVSRGAAFGDVDNDGDTDVLVVDANGPVRLLVNEVGSRRPWLGLRLVGPSPVPHTAGGGAVRRAERDMPGARVAVVRRGAPTLWRRAATDGSYASASDPRVLVGLGNAADVAEIQVFWPDGRAEAFPPPPLRAYTTIHQGTGRPLAPPRATGPRR
jgi:hypothetical protein